MRPGISGRANAGVGRAERGAGAGGDELGAAVDELVDVLGVVGVGGDEGFGGGEEGAAVVGHEEAVLGGLDVGGGGAAVGVAGVADDGAGGGGVGVHLEVAGVVVGGELGGGDEGDVGVVRGDLEAGEGAVGAGALLLRVAGMFAIPLTVGTWGAEGGDVVEPGRRGSRRGSRRRGRRGSRRAARGSRSRCRRFGGDGGCRRCRCRRAAAGPGVGIGERGPNVALFGPGDFVVAGEFAVRSCMAEVRRRVASGGVAGFAGVAGVVGLGDEGEGVAFLLRRLRDHM